MRALPVNVRSEGSGLLSPVEWSNGEAIKQTASGGRVSFTDSCVQPPTLWV